MNKLVNDIVHINDALIEAGVIKDDDMFKSEYFGVISLKFIKGMIIQIVKEESLTLNNN